MNCQPNCTCFCPGADVPLPVQMEAGSGSEQVNVLLFGTSPFNASILTNPNYPSGSPLIQSIGIYGGNLQITLNPPLLADTPGSYTGVVQVCNACGSVDIPVTVQAVQVVLPDLCSGITSLFTDAARPMTTGDKVLASVGGVCTLVDPPLPPPPAITCEIVQALFVDLARPMTAGDKIMAFVGENCVYVDPPAITCGIIQALFTDLARPAAPGDKLMAFVAGACRYVDPPAGGGGDLCAQMDGYISGDPPTLLEFNETPTGRPNLTGLMVPGIYDIESGSCGMFNIRDIACSMLFYAPSGPYPDDSGGPSGSSFQFVMTWNNSELEGCWRADANLATEVLTFDTNSITAAGSTRIPAANNAAGDSGYITIDDLSVVVCGNCGGGGGIDPESFARYIGYADQLDTPITSDWAVLGIAAATPDPSNSSITMRHFFQVTDAVGQIVRIPNLAQDLTIELVHRNNAMNFNLYFRRVTPVGAWSAPVVLACPGSGSYTKTIFTNTLAGWGLVAGQEYQMELVDNVPGNNIYLLAWHSTFF